MQFDNKKFKELYTSKGLSQAEIALKLGVSAMSVHYYEMSERQPSLKVLGRMCKEFGLTPNDFIKEETDTNENTKN